MGSTESSRDVDIDLTRLAVAVWQRKGRIALITLLAGATALVASSLIAPRYKGEARLLIESRGVSVSPSDVGSRSDEPVLDSLNIVSQSQVLQSVDLIKRVADDLRLYEREEFDPDAKPGFLSHLLIGAGLKADPKNVPPTERVLKAFREKLTVYQIENSRVISVEFASEDPKLAAEVPNHLLKTYMDMQSGAKLDTSTDAAKWLEPEIALLRTKVRQADKKVADFRSSADLLSVGEGNTFAARQLSDISAELARVRTEKATADARAENVRQAIAAGRPIDNFSDVVGSAMIQRLKESESAIQGQISDLSTTMLDGHPRLRGLRAQLAGIREQISAEARKIVSTLENEASIASIREQQLQDQLAELKANSARAGEQEVELNELEREAAAQRQLLETYLARYREATSKANAQDSTPADARIISSAVEPREAYFPKTGANVVVASLAALILSAIVIMLIELFSGRALRPVGRNMPDELDAKPASQSAPLENQVANTPVEVPEPVSHEDQPTEDVAEDLTFPVETPAKEPALAVNEGLDNGSEQVLPEAEQLEGSEPIAARDMSYADFSVTTVADFLSMRGAKPVVVVVSPSGEDGSAQTVKLARLLADYGRLTVVVDMTVSGVPTSMMSDGANLPGIMDLLVGDAAFGEAIHADKNSNAHIVPRGVVTPKGPVKVYEQLAMVVGALSDAYATVLIECGSAKLESVKRIVSHIPAEVVISMPNGDAEKIDELLHDLKAAGLEDIMPMTDIDRMRAR